MPPEQNQPAPAPRRIHIRSRLQADVIPWWIVSASLFVVGAGAVLAAVRSEKRR